MNTDQLVSKTTRAVVALYLVTGVHHVIEGAGLVFDFRLRSLLTPVTFGVPLVMTAGLLTLYKRTRHGFVLAVFTCAAVLWWIVGIGLSDGLYNHTANLVLSVAHVPTGVLKSIYPSYVPPPTAGRFTMPCDGIRYSYCSITPATVAYEAAGIASFALACLVALNVWRLVRQRDRGGHPAGHKASRPVVAGASLGMVTSFGITPLLGMYMATGRTISLVIAGVLMAIGFAAITSALRATTALSEGQSSTTRQG